MWTWSIIILYLKIVLADIIPVSEKSSLKEGEANKWMEKYHREAQIIANKKTESEWNFSVDLNDENKKKKVDGDQIYAEFVKQKAIEARQFDFKNFKNETLKRLFENVVILNDMGLNPPDFLKFHETLNDMEEIFSTATICDTIDNHCNYSYDPHVERIFAESRNYERLENAWTKWRDATGKKMRELYKVYVELGNKAARLDNFPDLGASWRRPYESHTFPEDLDKLYAKIQPFYQELHAFVRGHLDKQYNGRASVKGTIKAHLLGNMWAQSWIDIFDLLKPYDKQSIDVTPKIQKMSVKQMFKTAEEFFTSLGLEPMPLMFWEKSLFEKPANRDNVVCHASAWDFRNSKDFRIKMCTSKNMRQFITIHHEMGHIQYYLQYKDLHILFQDGANPGFHEAVGDTLALSVQTPKHLMEKGLLDNFVEDKEVDINYLMMTALDKLAFIPFAYLVDIWRWNVFNGSYSHTEWNRKWWQLRCKYQGVIPPVTRSEKDFDPAAKYHVAGDTPYIRYFVSYILQFQFYQSLCKAANYAGKDYFKCDFYRSKEAGQKLKEMLRLGSSKKWQEAIKFISGVDYMDPQPFLDYFEPLYRWLKEQNAKHGYQLGWNCSALDDLLVSHSGAVQFSLGLTIFCIILYYFVGCSFYNFQSL